MIHRQTISPEGVVVSRQRLRLSDVVLPLPGPAVRPRGPVQAAPVPPAKRFTRAITPAQRFTRAITPAQRFTRAITPADAHLAGQLYWAFLRRFGRPVLSVQEHPSGAIDISLPGLRLLSFGPPEVVRLETSPPDAATAGPGWALRCPINGGAAVHPRHAREGFLQMGLTPDAVSLTVEGYYPNLIRLHTRIYEWTQSALHLRVARGYLPFLAQRLLQEATDP